MSAQQDTVKNVLITLDAGYVFHHRELQSTSELLMNAFKQNVLEEEQIRKTALSAIAKVVDEERDAATSAGAGASQYRPLHDTLLALFMRLDGYSSLEHSIVQGTRSFYAAEAGKLVQNDAAESAATIEGYLNHTQQRIEQEMEREAWLLQLDTGKGKLVDIARDELVKQKAHWLTGGLPALLALSSATDTEDGNSQAPPIASLSLLYAHLSSVALLEPLTTIFVNHIVEIGTKIVNPASAAAAAKVKKPPQSEADKELLRAATADEENLIDRLLRFKERIDSSVEDAFKQDLTFIAKRKEAFEKVVNSRTGGGKVAELCAKYLDVKLKSGNRTMTDEELERCLDSVLTLFRYTHAKDMFEEFYKRHFAKRLLLNRSASSDAEMSMLLKLKEECGPAFTQRLETMLKDMTLSDEMMKAYGAMKSTAGVGEDQQPFELSVNVLTQAHWPTYPVAEVRIPPAMAAATERFRTFYAARNAGRRLHWAHSLGTCTITANFPKCGEKELHVSEFQAIVLLLFNGLQSGEKLSYTAIREQTGLDDVELKRTLQSLACGQIPTRVIRKDPQGRDVDDTDHFHLNDNFKNERHRIRINQIQMKETQEEQASTEHRVLLDRELVLQAAAVRILKARKQIKHAELLQDVVDAIKARFQVDVSEIKKTFEILIEKEYMERVEGERGVYRYLA